MYTFDDDADELVRQAELESQQNIAAMELENNPAIQRANAANAAALDRAQRIANRDPNTYNPDRPSTWGAPDSPRLMERARNIKPTAEQTAQAQAQRQSVTGETVGDDARGRIRARSAAADQALAERETSAEELASMRAMAGRAQFGEAFDAAGKRIAVTRNNPRYPSTKKFTNTMLGDGSVSQAVGPDGQPMFETQLVDEPIVGADGQPMLDPMNPSGPPLTRKVEKQVPVLQRNTGLLGGEREAALGLQSAELDREMEQTNLLSQQAMMRRQLHNDMLTTQVAQRQRAEAVRRNVDEAYKGVQRATAEFAKADDIDPDRGWGEKGAGAKVLAIIAAGLLGFSGQDPMTHINSVIDRSIDAQKANLAKAQARVGEARGQQAAAVSAYDQIRAQIADESLADEAYRLSALESIKAQAMAKLQNANVKVVSAQQQAFLNGLDQQIADKRRTIELVSATTPSTITTVRSPYTPEQRAMIKQMGTEGLKASTAGADKAIDIVAKRQEQERGIQGKIREDAAKAGLGSDEISEGEAKLMGAHVDNIKKAGEIVSLADDFKKKWGSRDIPGRGASRPFDAVFSPNELADLESDLSILGDEIGRLQSQGAVTPEEFERFDGWIKSGVGDAQLLKNIDRIQEFANKTIKQSEAALPKKLKARYRNVDPNILPDAEPNIVGATGRLNREPGTGVVVEDQ